jgi:hypothetical protein
MATTYFSSSGPQSRAPSITLPSGNNKQSVTVTYNPDTDKSTTNAPTTNKSRGGGSSRRATDSLGQPVSAAPQVTSQQEQDKQRSLVAQNNIIASAGKQSDSNYVYLARSMFADKDDLGQPVSSLPGKGGLGGSGTFNLGKNDIAPTFGTLVLSPNERIGRDVGYKPESTSYYDALVEGSFLGVTPTYGKDPTTFEGGIFGTTTAQRELSFSSDAPTLYGSRGVVVRMKAEDEFNKAAIKAMDIYNQPEILNLEKGVLGTSTSQGTQYSFSNEFFSGLPEYTKLVNTYGTRTKEEKISDINLGKMSFDSLPYKERLKSYGGTAAILGEQFVAGTIDLGLTIGGTALKTASKAAFDSTYYDPKELSSGKNNPFGLEVYRPKLFNKRTQDLRSIPISEQSAFETSNIPFIGLEYPNKISDIKGYIKELPTRRGAFLSQSAIVGVNLAGGKGLVSGGIKSFRAAKEIYAGELLATGSRFKALDLVGGEMISGISPLQIRTRIFAADELFTKPTKSSQLNKGALIDNIKIGETGLGEPLITSKGKQTNVQRGRIDYLVYKPKLSGADLTDIYNPKSISTTKFSRVTLRDNTFKISPTDKENVFDIKGFGTREVVYGGYNPYQISRYELGNKMFAKVEIQPFTTQGKAFRINSGQPNAFDISFGKSKFGKAIEKYSWQEGGAVIRTGRTFGKPLVGRASVGKGFDIYKQTGSIESDLGTIDLGKSFGVQKGSGRKIYTMFNIRSVTPNEVGIKVSYSTPSITPKDYGIKVTPLYTKGEFGYLASETKQINYKPVTSSVKSALTPPSLKPSKVSKTSQTLDIRGTNIQRGFNELSLGTKGGLRLGFDLSSVSSLGYLNSNRGFNNQLFFNNELYLQPQSSRTFQLQSQVTRQETPQKDYQLIGSRLRPNYSPTGFTPRDFNTTFFTPIVFGGLPSLGGYADRKSNYGGSKSPFNIAPGFTSIVANLKIKSPLKVSKSLGVTPFQVRGLYSGKGNYFKIV